MAAAAGAAPASPAGGAAMPLPPFKLERYFDRYEFNPGVKHLLCCSDSEPLALRQLLAAADADSLSRYEALSLAYTQCTGLHALREAIAARYATIAPEQVVVAAPQELVFLAMTALLAPGDHVVCCFPGYQSLYQVARSLGCEVTTWEPRHGGGGAGALRFDVDDLCALLRPGVTRCVVTNAPHNPTGWLPSLSEWQALLASCDAAGAVLFSDEMYRGLELDPAARLPSAADAYARGVSLCGVSKVVGLPGLRIGWLASKDSALLKRVLELKDYTTICSAAPSEVLALAGVRAWDALAAASMAVIRVNLALLRAFFLRWSGVLEWAEPAAGTVAFPRLLTGEPVGRFCEELAEQAGVLLLPATVYDHEPSMAEGRFRLGFGRRDLPACLDAFDVALRRRGLRPQEQG